MNPRIAGVRLSMLLHLYRMRLRSHAVQELLAGSGIAVGVALVLGVLVANSSLTGSSGELVHQVVGSAQLQLAARSPQGFDERLALQANRIPGVRVAAPVLRENAAIVGPKGRSAVQLFGVTIQAIRLGTFGKQENVRIQPGLQLPASVAAALGVHSGNRVEMLSMGVAHRILVRGVLNRGEYGGALASSPIAFAPLAIVQQLTGLPRRITQLYVEPRPNAAKVVERGLQSLAGSELDVEPADHELTLLEHAARPNSESTELFAAISVMVGFLLALNAMLLTVPERRRFVADLRMQGYDWRQILVLLAFQAIVLGLIASAAGVVLGDLLSRAFLHRVPGYLTTAFPVGSQEILRPGTVIVALGCGVLATLLASLSPALDLRPSRPTDAALLDREGGSEVIARRTSMHLGLLGCAAVTLISLMVLLEPKLTIVGGVALAVATLSAIPALFAWLARALSWTGERVRSSALIVVSSELRATTTRAVALAGIAALAVYGSVAIGGARDDLLRGLDTNFGELLQTADIWVTAGDNDLGTANPFPEKVAGTVRTAPGVRSVRTYQGGFLDVGGQRIWIIGRPNEDLPLIPASQVLHGEPSHAESLVRSGKWASVSEGFAAEHHLAVGSPFTLPAPTGRLTLHVAAITTNLGWAPGTIVLSQLVYSRFWDTSDPTALEVKLDPGISPEAGRRAVLGVLGGYSGLNVQTSAERRSAYSVESHQGLTALSQIATLLLVAAALAVASALSAAIWQRRARLASLKIQGYSTSQLWRALLLESSVVLGIGCIVGAIFGIYGHALATRWLRSNTGFPAPFTVGLPAVFLTLSLLAVIALAVITLPGLAAARAPARTSFQE